MRKELIERAQNIARQLTYNDDTLQAQAKHTLLEGAQQLGNSVLSRSFTYWHQMATDKATKEVDSKWNSCRCHGAGCHQCRERDE